MKFVIVAFKYVTVRGSPSPRRAWIEIITVTLIY